MSDPTRQAPPVGEEIHMPSPSFLPLVNAIGLSLAIVGITFAWWLVAIGLTLFLFTAFRWIADTRRDIEELPLEHHH